MTTTDEGADLLYGMPTVAQHPGLKIPQARHLLDNGTIPIFEVGKLTCARRSTLNAWLAERQAAAPAGQHRPPGRC